MLLFVFNLYKNLHTYGIIFILKFFFCICVCEHKKRIVKWNVNNLPNLFRNENEARLFINAIFSPLRFKYKFQRRLPVYFVALSVLTFFFFIIENNLYVHQEEP